MRTLKYHNIPEVDVNVGERVENPLNKNLVGFSFPELVFSFNKSIDEIRSVSQNRLPYQNLEHIAGHQPWILDYVDSPDPLQVNSLLFRSDEFKKEHEGKHILFSGCSNSYGVGLYNNEIWPWIVYNKIKEKEKVSGYYNLAITGIGTFNIVADIFKYIDTYSKPDTIFINLPNLSRFYSMPIYKDRVLDFTKEFNFLKTFPSWHHTVPSNAEDDNIRPKSAWAEQKPVEKHHLIHAERFIYVYQYLMMLETFCKANNIELYIFSHNLSTNWFLDQTDLDSFKNISRTKNDIKLTNDLMFEYISLNKNDNFTITSRDGVHEGTAYQYAWAELAYSWYKKDHNQ